jgi:hypothetical protein
MGNLLSTPHTLVEVIMMKVMALQLTAVAVPILRDIHIQIISPPKNRIKEHIQEDGNSIRS